MKYTIDGQYLTDIANAIREKTGETDSIKVEDMAEKIYGINNEGQRPNIINFTIFDYVYGYGITHTLQAEEGMTWGEWVNSEYNTFYNLPISEYEGVQFIGNITPVLLGDVEFDFISLDLSPYAPVSPTNIINAGENYCYIVSSYLFE